MKMYKYCIIFIIVFLIYSCKYLQPSVNDSIYRYDYQPFAEKTKAVKLTEKSTLILDDNLPRLDGATALYPLYAAFVQAVYPKNEYSSNHIWDSNTHSYILPLVGCSGTSYAYDNLINGKVDMIFCAKPSADQIEKAKKQGITFQLTPIGKEAFVFFVNKRNHVSNLTTDQIKDIYSGKITNWNELGGKNNSIRVYQRAKNSGSQTMLESIMENNKIIEPLTENRLSVMLDIITKTAVYRNYNDAIGYSFLFYTTQMVKNNKIKLLSINNITPTIETIQTETYPYTDNFYVITTETQNENVHKFIEWILSQQGQYLVKKTGYVPL